ncbi:hypothetical protein [Microbacterium sp. MTN4-26]|uniref:hypothetical protein n=1 Tax=unclassified Microbacterium TaxID=2609290 RepID=UPI0036F3EC4B
MNDQTSTSINAGQMIIDIIRTCSPDELRVLASICRDHTARSIDMTAYNLAELWNVLAITADHVLADHPQALSEADQAFLHSLSDTRDEGPEDV